MNIELRWLHLTHPFRARLQFREIQEDKDLFPVYGEWEDVPVVNKKDS